jgi:transcriptional regulator GlxA family with amidase domain
MSRRVAIVAFPGVQSLDVMGPFEVFQTAGLIARDAYEVEVVARDREPIVSSSGALIAAHRSLSGVRGDLDTLVVAGGTGVEDAERDEELIAWLRRTAARSRRVASVCTGALLLARAGLLDGRRATTHWAFCDLLRRRYPLIEVEDDRIYVRDGNVWTSAGVTAGMDLALALVEEDHGRSVALETARWLVMYLQRPGGQSQFSAQLAGQAAESGPVRELQAWMTENLDADLSVGALAQRAHMSPRNFARAFRREVGMTPAAYVEALRIERAKLELETSGAAVEAVARRCGFGTTETFRRAFRRRVGVSPGEYRSHFRAAA